MAIAPINFKDYPDPSGVPQGSDAAKVEARMKQWARDFTTSVRQGFSTLAAAPSVAAVAAPAAPTSSVSPPLVPPVPPQVNADWDATSGPAQILNKPAIPARQVAGPSGATDGNIPLFDGITGEILKDGGISPSSFDAAGSAAAAQAAAEAASDPAGSAATAQSIAIAVAEQYARSSSVIYAAGGSFGLNFALGNSGTIQLAANLDFSPASAGILAFGFQVLFISNPSPTATYTVTLNADWVGGGTTISLAPGEQMVMMAQCQHPAATDFDIHVNYIIQPTSLSPIGPAGGNLSGTYPNPFVTEIRDSAGVDYVITPLTVGQFLKVTGANLIGSAAGTGGGGVTQLLAGANISLSPVGGTGIVTITSTGGGGGSVVNFNVKNYGALGDGVTDDTTAIQNCINAAVATGIAFCIYFPGGVYIVSAKLTIALTGFVYGGGGGPTQSFSMLGDASASSIIIWASGASTYGFLVTYPVAQQDTVPRATQINVSRLSILTKSTVAGPAFKTTGVNTGVPPWVSGTAYLAGVLIEDTSNGINYNARNNVTSATPPNADPTNWAVANYNAAWLGWLFEDINMQLEGTGNGTWQNHFDLDQCQNMTFRDVYCWYDGPENVGSKALYIHVNPRLNNLGRLFIYSCSFVSHDQNIVLDAGGSAGGGFQGVIIADCNFIANVNCLIYQNPGTAVGGAEDWIIRDNYFLVGGNAGTTLVLGPANRSWVKDNFFDYHAGLVAHINTSNAGGGTESMNIHDNRFAGSGGGSWNSGIGTWSASTTYNTNNLAKDPTTGGNFACLHDGIMSATQPHSDPTNWSPATDIAILLTACASGNVHDNEFDGMAVDGNYDAATTNTTGHDNKFIYNNVLRTRVFVNAGTGNSL